MSLDFVLLPEQGDDNLITRSMHEWFTRERAASILIPLIEKTSTVSLRMLDWLVVNMAKEQNITCIRKSGEACNIHNDYKLTLSVYKRALFDPFRRSTRFRCVLRASE